MSVESREHEADEERRARLARCSLAWGKYGRGRSRRSESAKNGSAVTRHTRVAVRQSGSVLKRRRRAVVPSRALGEGRFPMEASIRPAATRCPAAAPIGRAPMG